MTVTHWVNQSLAKSTYDAPTFTILLHHPMIAADKNFTQTKFGAAAAHCAGQMAIWKSKTPARLSVPEGMKGKTADCLKCICVQQTLSNSHSSLSLCLPLPALMGVILEPVDLSVCCSCSPRPGLKEKSSSLAASHLLCSISRWEHLTDVRSICAVCCCRKKLPSTWLQVA